jgi:hypothetical protein
VPTVSTMNSTSTRPEIPMASSVDGYRGTG